MGLWRDTHGEYRPHELRPETLFTNVQQMRGEPSIEIIRPNRHCMSTRRVHALPVWDSPKAIDRHNQDRALELVSAVAQQL